MFKSLSGTNCFQILQDYSSLTRLSTKPLPIGIVTVTAYFFFSQHSNNLDRSKERLGDSSIIIRWSKVWIQALFLDD